MQRRGLSLIDQKMSKLQGSELRRIRGFYTALCPRHFCMKALSYSSVTSHSERIYIADVPRRGVSLLDRKLSKLGWSELRRIHGVFT